MNDLRVLLPYLVFCVVMTGTPGPNNTMALASGARVGLWRSMPLVSGIAVGVGLQLLAIGMGMGAVFDAFPVIHNLMRFGGAAYLLWLALKIARSGPIRSDAGDRPPLGFAGGMVFQWINPKAWAITTSAAATYLPEADYAANVTLAALLIVIIAIPCVSTWAMGGATLRRFLVDPRYATAFNVVAALALVLTTVPIILGMAAS